MIRRTFEIVAYAAMKGDFELENSIGCTLADKLNWLCTPWEARVRVARVHAAAGHVIQFAAHGLEKSGVVGRNPCAIIVGVVVAGILVGSRLIAGPGRSVIKAVAAGG